jgi:hypothetical protein
LFQQAVGDRRHQSGERAEQNVARDIRDSLLRVPMRGIDAPARARTNRKRGTERSENTHPFEIVAGA